MRCQTHSYVVTSEDDYIEFERDEKGSKYLPSLSDRTFVEILKGLIFIINELPEEVLFSENRYIWNNRVFTLSESHFKYSFFNDNIQGKAICSKELRLKFNRFFEELLNT